MAKFKGQWIGRERLQKRLAQLVPEADKQLAAAQLEAAQDLADKIRVRAPVGATGEYKASIHGEKITDARDKKTVGIRQTKDKNATGVYAEYIYRFLEFGTQAHTIKGKNGKLLFFNGKDGKPVSVKSVTHPGTPAQPHIFPTYRANKKKIRRKMANAVNKAVREIKKGGGIGALPAEITDDVA